MMVLIKIFLKCVTFFEFLYAKAILRRLRSEALNLGSNPIIETPINFYGPSYFTVGNNFTARRSCKIRAFDFLEGYNYSPHIIFGDNVHLGTNCHLAKIGNDVSFASYVTVIDHRHGKYDLSDLTIPVMKRELSSTEPIKIEDNVWLGEHVVVLPNVTIGPNSIIGANSVVTKTIPSNSIGVETPAKVIRTILL